MLNPRARLNALLFQRWYTEQVQVLCTWLTDRLDKALHPYQCTCLAHIVKVRLVFDSRFKAFKSLSKQRKKMHNLMYVEALLLINFVN